MIKRLFWLAVLPAFLFACTDKKSDGTAFEVKGSIANNPGKVIYLEEIPVATMQRVIVDSAVLKADGKFSLQADPREATVYNLRLDQNNYPLAQVINDAKIVTLDVQFNRENNQFPESYTVKGSDASQQLKDFMQAMNNKLQSLFLFDKRADSLGNANAPDSLLAALEAERVSTAKEIRALLDNALKSSNNPALTMTILGYYQSTANNPGFRLEPVDIDEVTRIVNDAATRFPNHQGVATIKTMLEAEARKATGWVGQSAPDFTLPDVNGKAISLSSFRGKYVLVDFWASWCKPCRLENPNVVQAWQKFKDKNFTILGVSLDRPGQKDEWVKAIREDNLTWTHVSDLQYWNSPVVPLYQIDGIPFNVLLDPAGKVVAQGLRGEALEAKLAELMP
jgi:thiol-disulfide isomerase/thioredoxin